MTRLPMVGIETDIAEIIERHLDVAAVVGDDGEAYSDVDGVEAAAVAIVEELRKRGVLRD